MENSNEGQAHKNEITLKDVILKGRFYFELLLAKWYIIGIFCVPFIVYFGYKHFNFKPQYEAEVKFLVEGSTSSFGGLGGLLGQFGIRNTGKANPFKIVEVARSNYILERILLDASEKPLIANRLIQLYQLDKAWSELDPNFKDFQFKHHSLSTLDSIEKHAYSRLANKVTGGKNQIDPVLTFVYDEETGVFKYRVNCIDENMALKLQEAAYNNLKKFFEEDMVENSINTTLVLREKADSIKNLITSKTAQMAAAQDRTLGLVMASPGVKKLTLEKEIQALTLAYAEVLKSYEVSDITLKDTKPLFLKLDESIAPLGSTSSSLYKSLIKAILSAFVVGGGIIIGKSIFQEIMA